jgi:O-acetylserine/cysteine efflux transporter
MKLSHQFLALLVVFIWGTNFVFIRLGLDELAPFTFATLRFALVAFPLMLFIPKPAVEWKYLVSYGVFIGFGQFGLLFWAMQANITPGLASLIVQMQVFFTILLAYFITKEAVSSRQLFALSLCFIGLMFILVFNDGKTTAMGVTVVLLAALSWACGNLVVKKAEAKNVLAFIIWSSLFAIPPLFLIAMISEGSDQFVQGVTQASWQAWGVVLWQSVGNTLIGYGLWNFLLNRYSAVMVVPWALLVPVFGMSASAFMLGESMPWWKLVAMAMILAGLTINLTRSQTKQKTGAN